jgi:hypothetical protein
MKYVTYKAIHVQTTLCDARIHKLAMWCASAVTALRRYVLLPGTRETDTHHEHVVSKNVCRRTSTHLKQYPYCQRTSSMVWLMHSTNG